MSRLLRYSKFWITIGVMAATIAVAFFITAQFVQPAPPKKVTIAASGKDTPYYRLAEQYQRYFREQGVTLEIRETQASFENLRLLADPKSGVDIGIIQGGLASSKGEARRLIRGGGARLNGDPITDENRAVTATEFAGGQLTLSAGRKRHVLVRAV